MIEINLPCGHKAIVDKEFFPFLRRWHWNFGGESKNNKRYVRVSIYIEKGKRIDLKMARLITGAVDGQIVDHINGNTLDNRLSNLRICNHQKNSFNRVKRYKKIGYKGVYRTGSNKSPWTAAIGLDYKRIHLGVFKTAEDAAMAYNKASKKYHGEFGNLNLIKEDR